MKKRVFLVILLSVFSIGAFASHMLGGEVKLWTTIVNGQTHVNVELKLLRDMMGISFPPNSIVYIKNITSGNGILDSITVIQDPSTGNYNVIQTGVALIVYNGSFIPTQQNATYEVYFENCCRQLFISNISGNPGYYLSATIDLSKGQNSKLNTLTNLIGYVPVNQVTKMSNFSIDPDNDSLFYSLETPLHGNALYVPNYVLPIAPASPVPFQINQNTGVISWHPTLLNTNAYRVRIQEYRLDTITGTRSLIATHNKDLFVVVKTGTTSNPPLLTPATTAISLPNGLLAAKFGDLKQNTIVLSYANLDPTKLNVVGYGDPFLLDSANTSITKTVTSANSCEITFAWTPSTQFVQPEPYYFVLRTIYYDFGNDLVFEAKVSSTASIAETSGLEFSIFPNPSADGLLHLKSESVSESYQIYIYDVTGRQVFSQKVMKNTKETAIQTHLGSGSYIIRTESAAASSTFNWVVY